MQIGFNRRMRLAPPIFSLVLAAAAALPGCGTSAPPSTAAASTAPPAPVPSARLLLDAERQRLTKLFEGTPVVFVTTSDGNLRATVPRRFCFDVGSSKVKPPLAAVLDRIAKSQAPADTRLRVVVPSDPNPRSPALAHERAQNVLDWLARQGIAQARLQMVAATTTEQVELTVFPDAPA